jgi:hypothetical protein
MMPDDWIDKDLLRPTDPSDARRSGPRGGVWLLVLVLAAAAAVAAYLAFGTWTSPEPETAAAIPAASPAQPARPLGGDPASVVLPPLDESWSESSSRSFRCTHGSRPGWLRMD